MPDSDLSIQAHAKLNLLLAVGSPVPQGSPDAGMHPICSWMVPIALADRIGLSELPHGTLSTHEIRWANTGEAVAWDPASDLTVRAHRLLEQFHHRELPLRLVCDKHTPAGGGLGGGSSDAGAVLRGIDALFDLRTPEADLLALGRSLGSDIAFFLDFGRRVGEPPRGAVVSGLGHVIERLEAPLNGDVTLIFPPFGCPTGSVYRAFDADLPPSFRADEVVAHAESGVMNSEGLFNDLAGAAERVEPRLADLRARASEIVGRPVHVSGSGSTLFVPEAIDDPHGLGAKLDTLFPDTTVCLTRFVNRDPLHFNQYE